MPLFRTALSAVEPLISRDIYTRYVQYKKKRIPKKWKVKEQRGVERVNTFDIFEVRDALINSTSGVYLEKIGYFYIFRSPKKVIYTMKGDGEKEDYLKYGRGDGKREVRPVFSPYYSYNDKVMHGWSMDKTFTNELCHNLYERLKEGKKYKCYPYTIKQLKKEIMSSNVEALIAQVKSDLSKYDDANLIDDTSLYRDIELGLKRFGNDVTYLQETVVVVERGFAEIPKSFFSLRAAYLCNPLGYTTSMQTDSLVNSVVYKERVINSTEWNDCSASCETITENVVRENVYYNGSSLQFIYNNPVLLGLGKSFKKSNCHASCRNKIVRDNPYEIVIIDYALQANFNEGHIYLQYYGLPTDEDGNIEIPDTKNGHLETYLEYFLKRRLTERLMGNNDAQGLQNLYQVYAQQESIALRNASTELKMSKLKPSTFRKLKRLNQLETLQFETNF